MYVCIYTGFVELREEVQKKVDKLMEPPPVKAPKPLPKPDDAPRKKRGGRRQVRLNKSCNTGPMALTRRRGGP